MKTFALLILAGCGAPDGAESDSASIKSMCDSRLLPTVDQSQPAGISMARLGQVSQTIVAGKTGQLSAVSMSVFYCGWDDRNADLLLTLLDGNGAPLAQARIGASKAPQSCSALPLGTQSLMFDFSAACLHVQSGQPLTLQLSTEGVTPGSCSYPSCSSGRVGQFCVEDADCASADLRAAMGFDTYLYGFASINGVGYAVYDLTFKTLVR
jgi:hypothetical protein